MAEQHGRFVGEEHPGTFDVVYPLVYQMMELRGGLNIHRSQNILRSGREVTTSNHDGFFDFFTVGIAKARAFKVPGKIELKSWKYGWIPGHFLEYMGAELFDRSDNASSLGPLLNCVRALREREIFIHNFMENTRKNSFADFTPMEGAAYMAVQATTEMMQCPLTPIGQSTAETVFGQPIQLIVGEPIYPPLGASKLKRPAKDKLVSELTEQAAAEVVILRDQSLELHHAGGGRPGEIVWNWDEQIAA